MSADAIIHNLRRHDRHYDGREPNRVAWCMYYREQLIEHGVITPHEHTPEEREALYSLNSINFFRLVTGYNPIDITVTRT